MTSGIQRTSSGSANGGLSYRRGCPVSMPPRSLRKSPDLSANASFLAASLTGSQSESSDPRSTSSIAVRDTENGTRSRTNGWQSRRCATTPSAGAATSSKCPVLTAAVVAGGTNHVDHAPSCDVALECSSRLQFDFPPGGFRYRGKFAIEIVHYEDPFRLPIFREPTGFVADTGWAPGHPFRAAVAGCPGNRRWA